ncbi:hypothetical protein J437_LFUL015911 [Ladona fulva]|uniref:Reverse transcriptase domain-containing protein n=1 Tax=Ladona fulva TaxID=123851 RepID=A0A8K0KNR9_LADFU|nr:hypothetical protein J437_LFUL015911 [Ladona fulva]
MYEYNNELHLFADFQNLVRLVDLFLDDTRAKIKLGNKICETFRVNTGLRQSNGLSPILFNIALEKVNRDIKKFNFHGVQVGNENITHFAYADDIVLLSHTAAELKMIMQALESTAIKYGLREPNIVGVMKSRRLEWAGHVVRMSKESWSKIAMDMIPAGKRPGGRPRKRWCQGRSAATWGLGRMATNANNRKEWRTLVITSRSPLG